MSEIIELIGHEIYTNFPSKKKPEHILENQYVIHCSSVFADDLKKSFLRDGWVFPVNIPPKTEEIRFIKYQIPNVGTIEIKIDMEQGYKIEEVYGYK